MRSNDFVRRIVALAIAALALACQLLANPFGHELIAEAAIFAIFAMSLDLLAASGLVSFGHAGFLGIGAYVFGGLTVLSGWPPGLALAAAIAAGAAFAAVAGFFVLRTSGVFFIMVTLAVSLMFYAWAFRNPTFNGADGMGGIPRLSLSAMGLDMDDPAIFSAVTIVLCLLVWIGLEIVLGAPFGRILAAIRQNPNRVRALGGSVFACRQAAYVASGSIAAFAGALTAQHTNFISPDIGNWFVSGDVLIAVVIGGIGTLTGPILGATLLVILKEVLSSHVGHWTLWLGAVFIAVALFMPRGIVGALLQWRNRHAASGPDRDETSSAGSP